MQEDIVKITSAVYKLLEVFPDADPLKTKTKERALTILENTTAVLQNHGWVSLKNYLSPDREQKVAVLRQDIDMVVQYIKLAQLQGWIDSVNALIVVKHYQELKNSLPRNEQKPQAPVVHVAPKAIIVKKADVKTSAPQLPEKMYSDRQKKILQILTKKGQAQVADLLKEIPDITKRTLRRDMDDLLKKGSAVRVGQFNQVFYKVSAQADRTSKMSYQEG